MRKIIHISDLHFGRIEDPLEEALREAIGRYAPDLVIVSGDITQRANVSQFQSARDFFSSLRHPILFVPGNHDVPLYSWRRFSRPYALYKRYISEELEPSYEDEEMIVIGINTVRTFKTMEGRVSGKQIARVQSALAAVPPGKTRIIVSHHPFNLPVGHRRKPLARARHFWKNLRGTRIDLILSGHLHDTLERYSDRAYRFSVSGPLLVQAGTAISTRRRKEENSFNLITLSEGHIEIGRCEYVRNKRSFIMKKTERFIRKDKKWTKDDSVREKNRID